MMEGTGAGVRAALVATVCGVVACGVSLSVEPPPADAGGRRDSRFTITTEDEVRPRLHVSVVRDAQTQACHGIVRWHTYRGVTVASLGAVPCDGEGAP